MFKPDDEGKEFRIREKRGHCFKVGTRVQMVQFINRENATFADLTGCVTQLLEPSDVIKTKGH